MVDAPIPTRETSTTLGVSIDSASMTAVLLEADGSLQPLQLGSSGPATAAAVAQGPDGAVLVGDPALRSAGPIATDPIGRASQGRAGALTAALAHVVGRAAALAGSTPRRLALVVPDESSREDRDRFVESGAAAGITDVVLVPISVAQTMKPPVDQIVMLAAAAAMVAKSGDRPPPIVTREDLGGQAPGPIVRPPTRAPQTPVGPRSVFGESTEEPPAAAVPRPDAAVGIESVADPTREIAITPAPPQPPPPPPPRNFDKPRKRRPVWMILVLIALVIAGVGAGVVAVVGGGSTTATPVSTTAPNSTVAPTTDAPTTVAPTTTAPAETSTSSTSSTSTTSTTTSTTTTSTTTVPAAVGVPGVITLVETGLQLDTATVLNFGQGDTEVIDLLNSALGAADLDSGWYETEFCLGSRTRIINWGDLEVVFTEDVLGSAIGTFSQWFVDGIDSPVGLVTIDGLGYGATVGFLDVTYGSALTIVEAIPDDPTGLFAVTNPASGGVLLGITTTLDPDGLVLSMWAGDSCTRIYT